MQNAEAKPASIADLTKEARAIVYGWRGPDGTGPVKASEPHAVVRFLRLREASGMSMQHFSKAAGCPTSTAYLWTKGCTSSGKQWPALMAALAAENGRAIAADMNAALAPVVDLGPPVISLVPNIEETPASNTTADDLPSLCITIAKAIVTDKRASGSPTIPWTVKQAAEIVRCYRESGLSMDAFSRATGTPRTAIASWNAGRTASDREWLPLCVALDLPHPARQPAIVMTAGSSSGIYLPTADRFEEDTDTGDIIVTTVKRLVYGTDEHRAAYVANLRTKARAS